MEGNFIEEHEKKTTDGWKGGVVYVEIYELRLVYSLLASILIGRAHCREHASCLLTQHGPARYQNP